MIDNLTLLAVHVALGILIWRLIGTPDPDEVQPRPMVRGDRFGRRTEAE